MKKCQEWLEKSHPSMYNRLWSTDALAQQTATLSVDAQKRAQKDAAKKAQKAEAAEAKLARMFSNLHAIEHDGMVFKHKLIYGTFRNNSCFESNNKACRA